MVFSYFGHLKYCPQLANMLMQSRCAGGGLWEAFVGLPAQVPTNMEEVADVLI